MDDQEIEDGVIVEEVDEIFQQAEQKNSGRAGMGFMAMLGALSAAVSNGDMTSHQAREMRNNLGVSQSYFTRKTPSKSKIKSKRKLQKMARKAQRGK